MSDISKSETTRVAGGYKEGSRRKLEELERSGELESNQSAYAANEEDIDTNRVVGGYKLLLREAKQRACEILEDNVSRECIHELVAGILL
ncbi:hypothetical protein EW146_g6506 [Bondarzewia mesenterica]|uniref:Uncharacterized protein n=1 Tax=Bondarzewia mesenterica TaxID=1095465 RepID=A0A4S4LNH7_9AGAM|nr:hypothetical protein EW146_g6506 [Bondarzewia mesenterica]